MNNWGITKHVLRTDADLEEAVYDIKEEQSDLANVVVSEDSDMVNEQLELIKSAPGQKLYEEWAKEEIRKDEACMERLLADKAVRKSLTERYMAMKPPANASSIQTIPDEVFNNFNKTDEEINAYSVLQGNLSSMWK